MLKKTLLTIAAIIAVVLIYAGLQSPDYVIQRQITIQAPSAKIFPYLNNMRLGEQWGPWKEADPTAKMTLEGPEEGVGAKTVWTGGKQMGTGQATIVESTAERVAIRIEYTEPMAMVQDSEYLLQSTGETSTVTWKVTGKNNFTGRVMCLFFNMDKMVGGMFEKGLSTLKDLVEKA